MERQKDWFTGINYYDNYKEKEIVVETKRIHKQTAPGFHEQVELLYFWEGEGEIQINGISYEAGAGSFLCLYSHHFHSIKNIKKPLRAVSIKFYIGLFMNMCWEKHPKNAHEKLVYDTKPVVVLTGKEKEETEYLIEQIQREKRDQRFENKNLIAYFTLSLHAYHCRYAFERIGSNPAEKKQVWHVVEQIILTTGDNLSLEELAKKTGQHPQTLYRRIKQETGYTFFQLQQYGKVLNACALLHFAELSLSYIQDLLNFPSQATFFRVFKQYTGKSPKQYQMQCLGGEPGLVEKESIGLQILQYLHLHFGHDITFTGLCEEFVMKEYSVREILEDVFSKSFQELLDEIRISYACALLLITGESVTHIANYCGFNSVSSFQRAFLRIMNQRPKAYRESLKQHIKYENKT